MVAKTFMIHLLALTLLLGILLNGCASSSPSQKGGCELVPTRQSHEVYHLAPLDQMEYTMDDGSQHVAKVNQDGSIEMDAGHLAQVLGLDLPDAESKLRGIIPHLRQIHWKEFHENSAAVLGEVYNQTKVDLGDAPLRMLDVIAAAGGFTPLSDPSAVVLVRRNAGNVQVFKLNLRNAMSGIAPQYNILVMPGDVITVPRSLL